LYPDLLRSQKERTKVGAMNTIFAQIGTILGIFITPLFIVYGDPSTYIFAAFVVSIIGFIFVLLLIPGMKEDDELIQRELRNIEELKKDKESYWQVLKTTAKQKNFMAYVFMYMFFYTVPILLMSSLPFYTIYILRSDNPTTETLVAASFLIGAFVSVPLWLKIGRKYGNRKAYIYGSFLCIFAFIPMFFVSDLVLSMIFFLIIGACMGAIWTLIYPGFSDVIDEIVVKTKKRKEGAYSGVRTFIGRLAFVIQALAFAIVHQVTRFKPGAETQEPSALFGIIFIMIGIPMFCMVMCFILIFFFYDLTKEKVKSNTEYLRNAGL
jgi:oligogalacturonide transporter